MSRAVNKDDETHEWWRRWRLLTMIRVLVESRGSIRAAIVCGGRYDFNLSSPASGSVGGHSLRSPLMASISHSSAVLVWSCNGPYLCDHLPARLLPEGQLLPITSDVCTQSPRDGMRYEGGIVRETEGGRERGRGRKREPGEWDKMPLENTSLYRHLIYFRTASMRLCFVCIWWFWQFMESSCLFVSAVHRKPGHRSPTAFYILLRAFYTFLCLFFQFFFLSWWHLFFHNESPTQIDMYLVCWPLHFSTCLPPPDCKTSLY